MHGMKISGPNGGKLLESEKLEVPMYTPCKSAMTKIHEVKRYSMKESLKGFLATKAEAGAKDENIHPDRGR